MSSPWIHCNKCYERPTSDRHSFHLTNCSHVICDPCLESAKQNCESAGKPFQCCVCSKPANIIPITSAMPKETRRIFTDIDKIYKEKMQEIGRIYRFQLDQAKSLIEKQRAKLKKSETKPKDELGTPQQSASNQNHQKTTTEVESLKSQIEYYKTEILKREEKISQLTKENAELSKRNASQQVRPRNQPGSSLDASHVNILISTPGIPQPKIYVRQIDSKEALELESSGQLNTSFHLKMDEDNPEAQDTSLHDTTMSILGLNEGQSQEMPRESKNERKSTSNASVSDELKFKRPRDPEKSSGQSLKNVSCMNLNTAPEVLNQSNGNKALPNGHKRISPDSTLLSRPPKQRNLGNIKAPTRELRTRPVSKSVAVPKLNEPAK